MARWRWRSSTAWSKEQSSSRSKARLTVPLWSKARTIRPERGSSQLLPSFCAHRRPERNPTPGSLSTAKLVPFFAATDTQSRFRGGNGDYRCVVRCGDVDSIRVYRFNNVQVLLSAGQKWARQGLTPVWPEHQTCTWNSLMVAGFVIAVGPSLPFPFIPNDSRHSVTATRLRSLLSACWP